MKTKNKKKQALNAKFFKRILFVLIFTCTGFLTTRAACTAGFTKTISGSGDGVVSFINSSSSTYTITFYNWNFGDGTYSYDKDPSAHTYKATGTYYVCLTVETDTATSLGYCSDTFCDTVYVYNSNSCLASYTFSSVGDTTISFVNQSVSSYTVTYFWDFGDGSTSNLENPVHTYTNSNYYYACLTLSSDSCSDTYCEYIYISYMGGGTGQTPCNADFAIVSDSLSNDSIVYAYNLSSGGINTTYTWSWGDGTTSTGQYPIHYYSSPGTYMVCLTVEDLVDTCSSTFCDTVAVYKTEGSMKEFHVIQQGTLGIKNNTFLNNNLLIAPNPFNNITNISYYLDEKANVEVSVYDMLGNKVAVLEKGVKLSGKYQREFNAESISPGIYLLRLNIDGRTSTSKLVLSK